MSEENRDYEKEALADGWNPNFEGPNKVDAKTFVERGEKISGMLKSKIGRLEERIDSLQHTNAEFKQYTDKQREKDVKENKRLVAELEKAKAQAITDGDGVAAVQAEKEIQELKVEEKPEGASEYNQMAQNWAADNKWYATNTKLSAFADGIADKIIQEGYQGQAYFNELTRRTKETFPEEFENPNRKKTPEVESGGPKGASDSKEHTWANLPADAKAAAKRFEEDIPGFDRKEYVANYEWE